MHISITYISYIVYSYHLISLPVGCQVPTSNLSESQRALKGLLTPAGGKAVSLVAAGGSQGHTVRPELACQRSGHLHVPSF